MVIFYSLIEANGTNHQASDDDLSSIFRHKKRKLYHAGLQIKGDEVGVDLEFCVGWSLEELVKWAEEWFPRISQWQNGQYASITAVQAQEKGKGRALSPLLLLPAFAKWSKIERLDVATCDAREMTKHLPKGRRSSGRLVFGKWPKQSAYQILIMMDSDPLCTSREHTVIMGRGRTCRGAFGKPRSPDSVIFDLG